MTTPSHTPQGPLTGIRVLEFASIGPGPFCAMLLADMGAEVLRIDRPGGVGGTGPNPCLQRGRPSLILDLKNPEHVAQAIEASKHADIIIEGNRPGVMERLGLGPDILCAQNSRLIYGRMTGYGQDGPEATSAGHDINYLAASGALEAISQPGTPPRAPLNLLADFGGGAMYLAFGLVAALHERATSGKGQIVDAAIVDGTLHIMNMMAGAVHSGSVKPDYEASVLGGGAPFYRCYECKDGAYIAVGSLEPKFYKAFLTAMGQEAFLQYEQRDPGHWAALCKILEGTFLMKTRAEWMEILRPIDSCINEVLSLDEVRASPTAAARAMFTNIGGLEQPAPAPRFSRTPGAIQSAAATPGEGGAERLARWQS